MQRAHPSLSPRVNISDVGCTVETYSVQCTHGTVLYGEHADSRVTLSARAPLSCEHSCYPVGSSILVTLSARAPLSCEQRLFLFWLSVVSRSPRCSRQQYALSGNIRGKGRS